MLRAVAGALAGGVRAGDLVGRFGGEEFVALLLPAADAQETAVVAERLRDQVAGLVVPLATGHAVRVTVSLGVVVSHPARCRCLTCSPRPTTACTEPRPGAGTRS